MLKSVALFGVVALAVNTASAQFVVHDDDSFFTGLPTTLIDLETFGDGSSVVGSPVLTGSEFAEQGLTFQFDGRSGATVRDLLSTSLDELFYGPALTAAASPRHALRLTPGNFSGVYSTVDLVFATPVHAFSTLAIFLTKNTDIPTRIDALNSAGEVIGSVLTDESIIDETITPIPDENTVSWGFIGFTSTEPIAAVRFFNSAPEINRYAHYFDDIRFSSVPGPGATALLAMAGVAGLRRRRC